MQARSFTMARFQMTHDRGMIPVSEAKEFKSWMCVVCGWIYHEEEGAPDDGIPPATRWEDVPESWVCPECGARKEDFEMVEI